MTAERLKSNNRPGVALLLVLFIVAMISVLSLGYAVKADRELMCGKNSGMRVEMDYLGQTALSYAKAHIINPQDVTTGVNNYWQGASGIQLVEGDEYFDITVSQSKTGITPECTYEVRCESYKLVDGQRISETKLLAQLRLDPYIAYWSGGSAAMTLPDSVTIYGDVYSENILTCNGMIYGDIYGTGFSGNRTGQIYNKTDCNVNWPGIQVWRFEPDYYIDTTRYSNIEPDNNTYTNINWGASELNPLGYYYCDSSLTLEDNCTITGTLAVKGDLIISGGNFRITSFKNNPAIIVQGEIRFENNCSAEIDGLVQSQKIKVCSDSSNITINGGLFVKNEGIEVESSYGGKIVINGDPMKTSIHLMSTIVNEQEWSPVGGAYYKFIKRY